MHPALALLTVCALRSSAATWAQVGEAPLAKWKRYRDVEAGIEFRYPPGALFAMDDDENGLPILKLGRGLSPDEPEGVVSQILFRVIPYGKAEVKLPDRSLRPVYDAKRNAWLGFPPGDADGTARPVCIQAVQLGEVWGYEHTDAMHGWSSTVVLGGDGNAYVLEGPLDADSFGIKVKDKIARTFRFLRKQKPRRAACPAPKKSP